MNELTTSKRKTKTVQLTFHIPETMKERLEFKNQNEIQEELESIKAAEALKIVEALRKIEAIKTVENLETAEINPEPAIPVIKKEKLHINDFIDDVYPYLALKLTNQQMIYKIGASFLEDIEKGQRNFAFSNIPSGSQGKSLLAYGSFLHYSLKQPVLVIVKDFGAKDFDKYRSNFTEGTLWKWKTHDWGNLCVVDYKEINKFTDELNKVDLNFICHEFSAVLWDLPSQNIQDELQKASLPILGKLDSVTFIVSKGFTKNKAVKKAAAYYECFSIPVKGVLLSEGEQEA